MGGGTSTSKMVSVAGVVMLPGQHLIVAYSHAAKWEVSHGFSYVVGDAGWTVSSETRIVGKETSRTIFCRGCGI